MNKNCIHDITVSLFSDAWDEKVVELRNDIPISLATIMFSDTLDEFEDIYLSIDSF